MALEGFTRFRPLDRPFAQPRLLGELLLALKTALP
jgi:hypothetical protein